ncbi:MAG: hypothetical protein R3253_04095 [Longimicrobiales bacterium]|nr:hypothetical protein [Longimicrobiales bacterium]
MTERSDRKLQQVPLASFNYRHEAEFAAGFLQDAGIPFRLQIEDPTLGLSATDSATIWVAAMDEGRARQVLDHEVVDSQEEWADDSEEWADDSWSAKALEEETEGGGASLTTPTRTEADATGASRPGPSRRKPQSDLTLRQRVMALGGSVGVSATLGVEIVRDASMGLPVVVAALAAVLALAGVFGWAPGPLRRLLEALSGDAP